MGQSVLVFISHASSDKIEYIEPIINDLQDCYINIWIDKRRILPGDNLRKSIFRDGLDKADIALIFFTSNSLNSSWVDREIKHVLREESKKGNDFDLNKIISIFDSEDTYEEISNRYPELTDDLLHLMPKDYSKIQLGQLISAIWSKYLNNQGDDIRTQKIILEKDRELFRKDKEINNLSEKLEKFKTSSTQGSFEEFESYLNSGEIDEFISDQSRFSIKTGNQVESHKIPNAEAAIAFELIENWKKNEGYLVLSKKGKEFFKYLILKENNQLQNDG